MKHIKKKYGFQLAVPEENVKAVSTRLEVTDKKSIQQAKKSDIYATTEDGYIIKCFLFQNNGENLIIPIPDLTLVYFDSAYNLNKLRIEQQQNLNKKIRGIGKQDLSEDAINEIYRYYGYSTSCLISLFTAIESFINHLIPDNKTYEKDCGYKTEIYTKSQIQKGLTFDEKTKKVLPYFFNKDFFKKPTAHTQHIYNLKELRDEIVHPKSEKNMASQEILMKRLLKFDYEKTMEAVANFMNFYQPNFISECKCGVDF
ncbi:MAG: hypothetical protein ACK4M1_08515 [Flavobacterium sp.]